MLIEEVSIRRPASPPLRSSGDFSSRIAGKSVNTSENNVVTLSDSGMRGTLTRKVYTVATSLTLRDANALAISAAVCDVSTIWASYVNAEMISAG
jgi:hypothetical protein